MADLHSPTTPQGEALNPTNSTPEEPSTSSSQPLPDNLDALLPKALRLTELLKANAENIVKTSARGTSMFAQFSIDFKCSLVCELYMY